jgi:asparagine synthase (glutamine-hydrolysing)
MCGIFAIFGSSLPDIELRKKLIECSQRLRHRGPDWSGYLVETGNGIAHERLAIIDPESGAQPLYSKDRSIVVAANGEIYNYQELYDNLETPYEPQTGSDCEVVIPLYQQVGISCISGSDFFQALSFLYAFLSFILCRKEPPSLPFFVACTLSSFTIAEMGPLLPSAITSERRLSTLATAQTVASGSPLK